MANYVSPTWVNDSSPSLNAANLQAITDTVEASQVLTGSSAPATSTAGVVGQYYANTSTTPPTRYVCTAVSGSTYTWTRVASNSAPAANGTASAGSSQSLSRADHVHPSDTTKADTATEIISVSVPSFSSLPQTISNAAISADHIVLREYLSNPASRISDWTVTTSNGGLTVTGTMQGSTSLLLVLGIAGTTI